MSRRRILQGISIRGGWTQAVQRPWSYRGADYATEGHVLLRFPGPVTCAPLNGPRSRHAWSMVREIQGQRRRTIASVPMGDLLEYLEAIDCPGNCAPFMCGNSVLDAKLLARSLRGLTSEDVVIRAPIVRLNSSQFADRSGAWTLYIMPMDRSKPAAVLADWARLREAAA